MPVIARYDLNDSGSTAADSAPFLGAQDGSYTDGATSVGGRAVLDGINDKVKIDSPVFQLARGTLEIQFSQSAQVGTGPNTVLSRDSVGETAGGYRVEVLPGGEVRITHESPDGSFVYSTGPGFLAPGDEVRLTYSWNDSGPGALTLQNLTAGTEQTNPVPAGLTMDMGPINQKWMIGAGQSNSTPDLLNNLDAYFQGSVEYFQISDSIDPPGGLPVANPDTAATDEDTAVDIPVLANDSDPDGQPLTVTGGTAPNGTVTVNPDGTLRYVPNPDFNGPDTITYTIRDPDGNTSTSTVTVTVRPVGDPPVANPDTAVTVEDTAVDIPVLANDREPDSQPLTVTGGTAPNGTVTVNPDDTLRYLPNPDYNGTDTITYTIRDPDGNTATSTVTVTVRPVNDDPVANPDSATTTVGVPVTVPVLINDTDVDGDTLSVLGTPTSPNGTVAVNPNGTITFTPAPGFTGTATVTYDITDGNGGTDTTTVTILVGAAPPPARDGFVDGTPGGDLIDTAYLGDPDGDRIDAGDAILPGDAPEDDRVRAGDGDDTIRSGEGSDLVLASDGNDLIDTSAPGVDQLPDRGYPGLYPADTDPLDDRDTVFGGAGNDTIFTGDDADLIFAEDGNDLVDGGFDDDTIFGGRGDDTLIGGEGADEINGGAGNDLIFGGLGPGAPDAINIPDATDLRPDNGRDTLFGGAGNDTIFGLDDADELIGGTGDDLLDGGIDNDTLFGGTGNDTLIGGDGVDTRTGGDDRDLFVGLQAGEVVNGGGGGDDFDTLDLRGTGPFRIVDRVEDAEGNGFDGRVEFLDGDRNVIGSATFTNIEEVIPCFTPGTLIATPRGEVPVEALRPGDHVITRDNGLREIAWTGRKTLDHLALSANPHLQPVLIRQGSLGNGLPERDMIVSPNHRMLVANDRTALYFDEHEVLVAAKHLIGARGVTGLHSAGTTYIHFMCDRHEVVLANGAWTETFQPGDYTLKGMGNAQRNEIFELFPELRSAQGLEDYVAARRTLKRHEAALLAG